MYGPPLRSKLRAFAGLEFCTVVLGIMRSRLGRSSITIVLRSVTDLQQRLQSVRVPCHCGKSPKNAPQSISERLKFKNSWGSCPQTPLATAPFACIAPGLLSEILETLLSRTTRKLPPLPMLSDCAKNPNHIF